MPKNPSAWILLALAAAWGIPSAAQPVYRCGDSYSQQPCPGGKQVPTEDSRTPAQRAQTTDAVRRQAAAADQMEKARLKQEAKAAGVSLPLAKAEAPPETADRTQSPAKAIKPKYFTAVSPRKPGDAGATRQPKQSAKKTPG
jgi:hypothetical protein